MAKIVLAPEAPDDLNSVSLANEVIEEFPFETTDPTVLGNATSHPFLDVEYDTEGAEARYRESNVDPETDPLSATNPDSLIPFDEAAIKEVEDAKAAEFAPVAIESGKDQDKKVVEGGVATTVAAAEADASQRTEKPVAAPVNRNAGDTN